MKNKILMFTLVMVLAFSSFSAYGFMNYFIPYFPDTENQLNVPTKNPTQPAPVPSVPATAASYEEQVVQLVNVERVKNGLPKLFLDKKICDVARAKSKDMADNNYFAHQSPTYGSAGDMLRKFGVSWTAWGENIASGQKTPQEVVSQWMNSPGHRANILSPNFALIGVGYYKDASGRPYWTQMFINDDK